MISRIALDSLPICSTPRAAWDRNSQIYFAAFGDPLFDSRGPSLPFKGVGTLEMNADFTLFNLTIDKRNESICENVLCGIKAVISLSSFIRLVYLRNLVSIARIESGIQFEFSKPCRVFPELLNTVPFWHYPEEHFHSRSAKGVFPWGNSKRETIEYHFVHCGQANENELLFRNGLIDETSDTIFSFQSSDPIRRHLGYRTQYSGIKMPLRFGEHHSENYDFRRCLLKAIKGRDETFMQPLKPAEQVVVTYDPYFPNQTAAMIVKEILERLGQAAAVIEDHYAMPSCHYDLRIHLSHGTIPGAYGLVADLLADPFVRKAKPLVEQILKSMRDFESGNASEADLMFRYKAWQESYCCWIELTDIPSQQLLRNQRQSLHQVVLPKEPNQHIYQTKVWEKLK